MSLFLKNATKEELINELFKRFEVRPINRKLEEVLKEVAKHIRTELEGKTPNDCSSTENLKDYLIKIGVFNEKVFLDFTKYNNNDFQSDN